MAQTQSDSLRTGVLSNKMYDARTLSLANTTIADVLGGAGIGINSALSGLYNKSSYYQFNSHHDWDNNLMQHHLTLPTLSAGPHHLTVRLGLLHRGFKGLPFTNPTILPEPDITMYRAEFAYAISISEYFSLGTLQGVSLSTTNRSKVQLWNYFADIGLVYAPVGPVSYGLVFRGLGNETNYEIIQSGQTTFKGRMARQILEIGATLRYPIEDRTYLSISFANEKRFGEDGLWYKGGIEIIPISFFSIRGGAIANFDQSHFIPRMGLGINTSVFKIDYMIAPNNLKGEQFHQIGITIQL